MVHIFKQPIGNRESRPVIFLPGWGFDGTILKLMEYRPQWIYPKTMIDPFSLLSDLHDYFDTNHIDKAILIGWSMGANLAVDFARRFPDRVADLTLIAMRNHWPGDEIEAIRTDLLKDQNFFLKNFYRKCFLGNKKAYKEFTKKLERRYMDTADSSLLAKGLEYLQKSSPLPPIDQSVHQIHGADDIIAPFREKAEIPGAIVETVARAGHLPFLSPSCSLTADSQKHMICRRFSSAAATYDESALLQKKIARMLIEKILTITNGKSPEQILEIGCGTGGYTSLLAASFSEAEIVALDFSKPMIAAAQEKLSKEMLVRFVCEDAENFLSVKKKERTFDLITSNATFQWFTDLKTALGNIHAMLNPGGLLAASIFGRESLKELGSGLTEIFKRKISLPAQDFPEQASLEKRAQHFFTDVDLQRTNIMRRYSSSLELLRQLKKTGTTGGRASNIPLLSKTKLASLDQWFADNYQGCQVSYEIFLLQCRK